MKLNKKKLKKIIERVVHHKIKEGIDGDLEKLMDWDIACPPHWKEADCIMDSIYDRLKDNLKNKPKMPTSIAGIGKVMRAVKHNTDLENDILDVSLRMAETGLDEDAMRGILLKAEEIAHAEWEHILQSSENNINELYGAPFANPHPGPTPEYGAPRAFQMGPEELEVMKQELEPEIIEILRSRSIDKSNAYEILALILKDLENQLGDFDYEYEPTPSTNPSLSEGKKTPLRARIRRPKGREWGIQGKV